MAHGKETNLSNTARIPHAIFALGISLIVGVYAELFREFVNSTKYETGIPLLTGGIGISTILFICLFAALAFALILIGKRFSPRVGEACFRWRYAIASICLIVLVLLKISGSSIGIWDVHISGQSYADIQGLIFGIPRMIRSDEWLVFTPEAFSQAANSYAAVSEILRGVATDVTMVYAQPAWTLATLFRPFLWGYLLFGSECGLSFFWCGRLIVLFMVSFEFGRLLTGDKRSLALAYAVFVSFAPIVQWWFAVNGTAELLIFVQGGVLAFTFWMRAGTTLKQVAGAVLFAYCCGCFILVIYPAWQVGAAWTMLALLVGSYVGRRAARSRKARTAQRKAEIKRWIILIVAMLVLAMALAVVLIGAWGPIQAVSHSVYPGQRCETGGGYAHLCLNYVAAWFAPTVATDLAQPNACEMASFFTLFPLGIILSAVLLRTKRDPLVIALLVVEAFLLLYAFVGFPEWLAKITLLSNVTIERLPMTLGFIETMLLFRSTALLSEVDRSESTLSRRRLIIIVACIVCAVLFSCVYYPLFQPQMAWKLFIIMSAVFIALAAFAFLSEAFLPSASWKIPCVAFVLLITGVCVNPIQQGASALLEAPLVQEISRIHSDDASATWLGDGNFASQAAIVAGAPTLSSVATYPSLDTWRTIDPDGLYENVYNRYAHISVRPTDEPTTFTLLYADAFEVALNVDDISKLGASYWISQYDLTQMSTASTRFEKMTDNPDGYNIYRIIY